MSTCDDCGLLAVKNRFTGELVQAGREYRTTGEAPFFSKEVPPANGRPFRSQYTYPFTNIPFCLAGLDLASAFSPDEWGDPVEVICFLRSRAACADFVPWIHVDEPDGKVPPLAHAILPDDRAVA